MILQEQIRLKAENEQLKKRVEVLEKIICNRKKKAKVKKVKKQKKE